jgi:hypothetical protein
LSTTGAFNSRASGSAYNDIITVRPHQFSIADGHSLQHVVGIQDWRGAPQASRHHPVSQPAGTAVSTVVVEDSPEWVAFLFDLLAGSHTVRSAAHRNRIPLTRAAGHQQDHLDFFTASLFCGLLRKRPQLFDLTPKMPFQQIADKFHLQAVQ